MDNNIGLPEQDPNILIQEEKNRAAQIESDICTKAVMSTKNGRHFVWEQLSDFGVYRDAFDPDPYIHAHAAGLKSAGLRILSNILATCSDSYDLMVSEHQHKEK